MKLKPLTSLTEREYVSLKNGGMLWEFYPEATGSYLIDSDKNTWATKKQEESYV